MMFRALLVAATLTARAPRPELVRLEVAGWGPAIVSAPAEDGLRKPLVVVAHGAGDRPDWQCDVWRSIVGPRAFVLCPRGRRIDDRVAEENAVFFYPNHYSFERETNAAIEALGRWAGDRVDTSAALYVGFSQGAIFGGLVVARAPRRYPRAVLIEGSYGLGRWDDGLARLYRRGGGERVLFVCGGWYCAENAGESAIAFERAGGLARVVRASGGHTYGGAVADAVRAALDWVVEGDPRWRP